LQLLKGNKPVYRAKAHTEHLCCLLFQHYRAEASRIHYFVFDLLVYKDRDLARLYLVERREIMKSVLNPKSRRVRITDYFETTAADMLNAIRTQGLEGVVAKKKDSRYEVGKRSGSWAKLSSD
jgi:ATP-dependent DNA ligase